MCFDSNHNPFIYHFYFTSINAVVYKPLSKAVVLLFIQVTFKPNKTYLQVPYQTRPFLKGIKHWSWHGGNFKTRMSFKSISLFII